MTEAQQAATLDGEVAPLRSRVAGAPISWGVCEVPGWGHQLDADRVLREMRSLGLAATEFGPSGFLEEEPAAKAAQLASYGMTAVGGFLPVLLHDRAHDPLPEVDAFLDGCLAAGAGVVVLAAFSGVDGYDARPALDDGGWSVLLGNLDRITDRAQARGVVACLHPHVGGGDPVALTARHPDRVVHVHLKDVDDGLAAQVRDGSLAFGEAVRAGMFRPLGEGDVDIAAMVRALESAGYAGWYVLEQDVRLDGPPSEEPSGEHGDAGPVADVRKSLDYLLRVAR
jgi:inosose dehydratase